MTTQNEITKQMKRWEKTINFYNKRDNFNTMDIATESEKKDYRMALNVWDQLKARRDVQNKASQKRLCC